jgi:uncharacterized protein
MVIKSLIKVLGVAGGAIVLLLGCNASQQTKDSTAKAKEGFESRDELYIVDCLLPGQQRRLGNMSYLSARRPIRTTTSDCRIRGGEYVEYDRADYRSALKVWLPQAEQGDAEAQNYVGEIFEKGLGQQPDYVSAISWYTKAADQGYSRAQINLGYMYEKGLGVTPNVTMALNLYRKASGIGDDQLVLNSEAQKELAATRDQMNAKLKSATTQTDFLQKQIASLKKDVGKQTQLAQQARNGVDPKELETAQQEIAALNELYEKAVKERKEIEGQRESMELAYRTYSKEKFLEPQDIEGAAARVDKNINFGRYFALIIGNQDYLFLDPLRSPIQDGKRLQQVLDEKYGFTTLLVENATEKNILNTINNFYEKIGENDNLLIYYAGHGNISHSDQSRTERGYWLPVDAGKEDISNWINNSVISDHLDRLRARSVLVIADSCYAGYLGSEKSPFLFGVSGVQSEKAIQTGISRRARVVISSGGVKPVLDGSGQDHSVFANALIESLENNKDTLRDSSLFAQLSVNVRKRSQHLADSQTPEMKPVREAGHEGGTFYFVPVN